MCMNHSGLTQKKIERAKKTLAASAQDDWIIYMIQSYLKIPQVRPLLVTLVCTFCLYSHPNIVWLDNKQKAPDIRLRLHFLVGMTGFEPAAPTSLTWCANRAAPHPESIYQHRSPLTNFQ
jgi:hypothetical protein